MNDDEGRLIVLSYAEHRLQTLELQYRGAQGVAGLDQDRTSLPPNWIAQLEYSPCRAQQTEPRVCCLYSISAAFLCNSRMFLRKLEHSHRVASVEVGGAPTIISPTPFLPSLLELQPRPHAFYIYDDATISQEPLHQSTCSTLPLSGPALSAGSQTLLWACTPPPDGSATAPAAPSSNLTRAQVSARRVERRSRPKDAECDLLAARFCRTTNGR